MPSKISTIDEVLCVIIEQQSWIVLFTGKSCCCPWDALWRVVIFRDNRRGKPMDSEREEKPAVAAKFTVVFLYW